MGIVLCLVLNCVEATSAVLSETVLCDSFKALSSLFLGVVLDPGSDAWAL